MARTIAIKNLHQIQEVEYCLTNYFLANIIPIMNSAKKDLQQAQAKEIGDYQMSFAGVMRSFASASNPYAVDDSLHYLKITGEECSKTAEDYVAMVAGRINADEECQSDLARIAHEWRDAVVKAVGKERYDDISAQLGADLALSYVDYRIEQMIIDKMVRDKMPKSAAEYIIRKGAENSLLGLAKQGMKSPLEIEIESKADAAFKAPKSAEWGARGLSLGFDIAATGGVCSWGALARVAGMEVVFAGMESFLDKETERSNGMTVEQCISSALWGTTTNLFPSIRKDNWKIKAYESEYLQSLNESLLKKMPFLTEKPLWEATDWGNPGAVASMVIWQTPTMDIPSPLTAFDFKKEELDIDRSGIPSPIAIGQEEEYRNFVETQGQRQGKPCELSSQDASDTPTVNPQEGQQAEDAQDNSIGWSNLLQSFGLDGMGDLGRNLPYVISMLPDMLVGLLTGKTKSVSLKKEMIPMASILLGLFVKNPLLKMVLIGMGGANLLNKMGHEAIDRQEFPKRQFRQYPDEALNPRILNPQIQGSVMVATIDGIPCSITVSENAACACATGALPINVLANAILAKHDHAQSIALEAYRNVQTENELQRERGVALR